MSSDSGSTLYFYGKAIPGQAEVTKEAVTTHLFPGEVDKMVDAISELRTDSNSHVPVTYDHDVVKCGRVIAGYRTKDNGLGCIGSVDDPQAAKSMREAMERNRSSNKQLMGISPWNSVQLLIDPSAPRDPMRSGKELVEMYHMSLVPEPDYGENGTWVEHADTDPAAFFENFSRNMDKNVSYFNKADKDALNLLQRRLQYSKLAPPAAGYKRFYKGHSATASQKEIAIDSGSLLGQVLKEVSPVLPIEYAPADVQEKYKFPENGMRPAVGAASAAETLSIVPSAEEQPSSAEGGSAAGTNKIEDAASMAQEPATLPTQEEVLLEKETSATATMTDAAAAAAAAASSSSMAQAPAMFDLKAPGSAPPAAHSAAPVQTQTTTEGATLPNLGAEVAASDNRAKRKAPDVQPEATNENQVNDADASAAKRVATEQKVADPTGAQPHMFKRGEPLPKDAKIIAEAGEIQELLNAEAEKAINQYKEKLRLEAIQAQRQQLLEDYHAAGASQSELTDAIDLLKHPGTGDAGYKAVQRLVVALKASKAGQPGLAGVQSGRQAEASVQSTLKDMEASANAKAAAAGVNSSSASVTQQVAPESAQYFKLSAFYASSRYGMPPLPGSLQFQMPTTPLAAGTSSPIHSQMGAPPASQPPPAMDMYSQKKHMKAAAADEYRSKSVEAFHNFMKLSVSDPDIKIRTLESQQRVAGEIVTMMGNRLPFGQVQLGQMNFMELPDRTN